LECSETSVFDPKTPVFASKTGFFDPKTGFFDPNLFPKFLPVQFPKNFQTSITELFQNLQKQKVRKILSFTGP